MRVRASQVRYKGSIHFSLNLTGQFGVNEPRKRCQSLWNLRRNAGHQTSMEYRHNAVRCFAGRGSLASAQCFASTAQCPQRALDPDPSPQRLTAQGESE